MIKLCASLLLFVPLWTIAQVDQRRLVDSLAYVTDMPYICESELPYAIGCGSKIFWEVVQKKEAIIPFLIDKLTDTTTTEAYVPNLGGKYAVADVAYFALNEIIDGIPTFDLLGVAFDAHGCGFCSYWNYLREDMEHRKGFQSSVKEWYNTNKPNLIWVPSGQPFSGHQNGGMFHLKK